MQCPVCKSVSLTMSERQGIEIDYCPQCRGVWLDRGELDKIIDRSLGAAPMQESQASYANQPDPHYGHSGNHPGNYQSGYHKRKKREGFLSELFDFD